MFRMLTCFNLKPTETIDGFCAALDRFSSHLRDIDLVQETGPVGKRQRHEIMDTDEERDHEYFFLMAFRDRAQCDRAVGHMYSGQRPGDTIHKDVYSRIKDPVFICWEDLPS